MSDFIAAPFMFMVWVLLWITALLTGKIFFIVEAEPGDEDELDD